MDKKINILYFLDTLNTGGTEILLLNIIKKINKNKFKIRIVVFNSNVKYKLEDYFIENKVDIQYSPIIPFNPLKVNLISLIKYICWWSKYFKTYKIDIIHCNTTTTLFWMIFFSKIYRKKIIIHSHTSNVSGIKNKLINSFNKLITKKANYCVACSNEAAEWLFGKNYNRIIFRNGIDSTKYIFDIKKREYFKKSLNLEKKLIIGHVGNILYPKNHEFLVDVFFEIQKLRPDSVLLLLGDGNLREKIENKVKKYCIEDKVIFLGIVNNVNEIINSMDIFVFPSLYEGLPVTLIEAQANGLKCIVSDRITKEVKITDLVEFLPLEKGAKYWADYILNSIDYERKNRYDEIVKAGYDINNNVKLLENFYFYISTMIRKI